MKRKITLLFVLMLSSVITANAQLLENILIERWDGNAWISNWQYIKTYDDKDHLAAELVQRYDITSKTWNNFNKFSYTNNNAGDIVITLIELWDGEKWIIPHKLTNTYTAAGKLKSTITESFTTGNWIKKDRHIYTYDTNNYLTKHAFEKWEKTNNSWEKNYLDTYTNNAMGNVTESLKQTWDTVINSYTDNSRLLYTYNDLGREIISIQQRFDKKNNDWINISKTVKVYYNDNYLIRDTTFVWSGDENKWSKNSGISIYTNSPTGLLLQTVTQGWRGSLNRYMNNNRYTYTYSQTSGIADAETNKKTFIFYPNPAQNVLNINIAKNSKANIQILNVNGQLIRTLVLNSAYNIINIEDLPQGMYFLHVHSDNSVSIKHFIKN